MRILDVFMAIPGMLLLLAIVAALGTGLDKTVLAVAVISVPGFARIIRSLFRFTHGESDCAADVFPCAFGIRKTSSPIGVNALTSLHHGTLCAQMALRETREKATKIRAISSNGQGEPASRWPDSRWPHDHCAASLPAHSMRSIFSKATAMGHVAVQDSSIAEA